MNKIPVILVLGFLLLLSLLSSASALDANSLFLKVSVEEGAKAKRPLLITGEIEEKIFLTIDLDGVSVPEWSFNLEDGQKEIMIDFDSDVIGSGVYVGALLITGESEEISVPVIFEVESPDVFYDSTINVPPQYTIIPVGGNFLAHVKIFDLVSFGKQKALSGTVDVDYRIYDLSGNIMSAETEQALVEGQVQIAKNIKFPAYIRAGDYVFAVVIKYGSSITTATHFLSVVEDQNKQEKENDALNIIIVLSIFFFFVLLVVLFIFIIRDRDKFVLALKRHHSLQLSKFQEFFSRQAQIVKNKRIYPPKEQNKIVHQEIQTKIAPIKSHHKKQVKHMHRLSRKLDVKGMESQLEAWKKAGYDIKGLDYRIKGVTEKEMKKLLEQMKKKYAAKTEGYKKKK